MKLRSIALASFAAFTVHAQADVVALWDYTTASTKQTQSANGASFAAIGGVVTSFSAGITGQALGTATYAGQGTGDMTRGVQYMVDTSGYTTEDGLVVVDLAGGDSANTLVIDAWRDLL